MEPLIYIYMWLGFPVVMAVEPWVCGAGRELFMAVEEH